VDGQPARVVAADLAATGVFVPAGEHSVRVTWTIPGLALGAAISALALLVALVLSLIR
jgi:uncharacterized membrane protein YfhO